MAAKTKEENWPHADHKEVIETIRQITEHAEEFTPFEADFLKELLRCAMRFRETFRMTPKQADVLKDLDDRYLLPCRIEAKVKKADPLTATKQSLENSHEQSPRPPA